MGSLLFWQRLWFLKRQLFWRKLFGMLMFPLVPDSHDDLPHDYPLEQRHIHTHDQHHRPPLWESRQDAQRFYRIGAYDGDKVEEKEQHCQQSRVGDAQQCEPDAGTQGAYERKQQGAPKVPTQALIEGLQQEVERTSQRYGC